MKRKALEVSYSSFYMPMQLRNNLFFSFFPFCLIHTHPNFFFFANLYKDFVKFSPPSILYVEIKQD